MNIESAEIIFKLTLLGIDISITSAVIVVWLAVIITFALAYIAVYKASVVPNKIQSVFEILYLFWQEQTKDLFQEDSKSYLPFVFALFCFILVCNLLALIPNVYPLTANINATVTLAVMVFFVYHFAGVRKNGFLHYIKSFLPQDMPIYIMPLLIPIEFLSHLARPFSLSIRLFANMTAGHMVTFTLLSLIFIFKNVWLAGFPLLGRVAVGLFEVFVAFVQAYIFAYLAALYIGLAVSSEG